MSKESHDYQPGAILHDAVVGAFRARGEGIEAWCRENGVSPASARNATYGQSKGPKGRALRNRIIAAAGVELVEIAYRRRLREHAEAIALVSR